MALCSTVFTRLAVVNGCSHREGGIDHSELRPIGTLRACLHSTCLSARRPCRHTQRRSGRLLTGGKEVGMPNNALARNSGPGFPHEMCHLSVHREPFQRSPGMKSFPRGSLELQL